MSFTVAMYSRTAVLKTKGYCTTGNLSNVKSGRR